MICAKVISLFFQTGYWSDQPLSIEFYVVRMRLFHNEYTHIMKQATRQAESTKIPSISKAIHFKAPSIYRPC